jgi:hypothetical protein
MVGLSYALTMKYGVWATRSGGMFGYAAAWAKDTDGNTILFDTLAEAEAKATEYNHRTSSLNVSYSARRYAPAFLFSFPQCR